MRPMVILGFLFPALALAQSGTSPVVVVPDSAPLVHTDQVLVEGDGTSARQLQAASRRLREILEEAGSSLDRLVKLSFVIRKAEHRQAIDAALTRGTFGKAKPAVSFVQGELASPNAWAALDAVAIGTRRMEWKHVVHAKRSAVLPPGTRIYISGQADRSKDLREATRKTFGQLAETLKFRRVDASAVVQVKAFVQPIEQAEIVREETAKFFASAKAKVPPVVLVEWQSSLPIEIEMVVWGGRERAGEPIEYLTPPGMKSSPVFSRVVRINYGKLLYLSGLVGDAKNDPAAEIPSIFEQMGKVLKDAGSDYRHLAKATYYVTSATATKKMGELRPKYYDPKRPPAASLALVRGVGQPGRCVTVDMIAVPSPNVNLNEYGPAERGFGLSAKQLQTGYISLFDGKTTYGWADAQVEQGMLSGGQSHFAAKHGELRLDVRKPGSLQWGTTTPLGNVGVVDLLKEKPLQRPEPIRLEGDLRLRSILFRPEKMQDITPRELGGMWKPLYHPPLPKERRPTWTIDAGVLTAIGGPGCLEYQRPFANFVLQLEVRTRRRHTNGGVFFRSIPGSFMNGYEAQIYNRCHDGDTSKPWRWATGAIDDRQNTRRVVSRDGEWFHYTIVAIDNRIATWVNGYQTVDWLDTREKHDNPRQGQRTKAGTIQLQAHDPATHVEFRNIRIAEWK